MSNRMTTWQKASALIPLALLSGAWTASLAVTSATAEDDSSSSSRLPDGSTVPSEAIDDPASISAPGQIAPGVSSGDADKVLSSASTNGIPAAALAAYQRAAQVIDSADASCNIEWPLIAAIGRVESNHGTYGGNRLTSDGVSTPGIIGIPLNGSNNTAEITDTDAGRYDGDKQFDRAVGPMQFIPSTWSVVGVDGDGDGERNPQDINDAALATAVYLCSGDENLGTRAGQESAVYRYNNSDEYVELVLSIAQAYAAGDYTATPNSSTGSTTFSPAYGDSVYSGKGGGGVQGYKGPRESRSQAPAPTTGGSSSGGVFTGGGTSSGGDSDGEAPVPAPSSGGEDPVTSGGDTAGGAVESGGETVQKTLTPLQQAQKYCSANYPDLSGCVDAYLSGGDSAVQNLLSGAGGAVKDTTKGLGLG